MKNSFLNPLRHVPSFVRKICLFYDAMGGSGDEDTKETLKSPLGLETTNWQSISTCTLTNRQRMKKWEEFHRSESTKEEFKPNGIIQFQRWLIQSRYEWERFTIASSSISAVTRSKRKLQSPTQHNTGKIDVQICCHSRSLTRRCVTSLDDDPLVTCDFLLLTLPVLAACQIRSVSLFREIKLMINIHWNCLIFSLFIYDEDRRHSNKSKGTDSSIESFPF